jgi:membrane-bound serine protease (ClpP class)
LSWLLGTAAGIAAERVNLIKVEGPIGPATAGFISRAIDQAAENQSQCLVIQLDTPGGLLDSTKTIVQKFLGSPVPTVVYVAPAGATATSAGCFITLAADLAVMAPATSIGAAHPVAIGGNPVGGEEKLDDTMKQKLENYAVSYIEIIAARRNRNVEWAKSSVKESASISAEKALQLKVIDLIAKDVPDRADLAFRLSLSIISSATVVTALFFIAIVGAGLRAQFLPVRAGRETMLGKVTPALARIDATGGKVFIEGEYWNAVSETVVEKGQPVEVLGFDGLTLKVKPKTQ